jgi:ABC-type multidrug transport system fused ATPase/permease subunit
MYIAISSYSTKRWGKLQAEKNIHEDATRGRISEVINNIKLVKTYNTQPAEWNFVSTKYTTINKIYDKQSTGYHILNFLREFGLEIAFVIILFLIFRKTFLGELTLGEMVMIIQLLAQLRWPLYGMSYMLEQLHLQTKETVALVGHSGAGKSTLINLILKLYEPTSGEIYLSDKKYTEVDHSWVREHIALVFQDNELFSSTIRENVAYGAPTTSDTAIITALKQANAWEFVEKLQGGLDAQIGERGLKLSGGQKQRIQIARAILHDKPILILDEATSSLDSKSERLVQEALEKLFKNRLTIIIAHRFLTIQNVDRIVVLDSGTIVDSGKPEELARRKGLYSELLQYQMQGNKKLLSQYELY